MSVTIGVRSLFGFAAGVAAAIVAVLTFQAMTADAVQPGESTFVPVTPCRLFDTRPGTFNVGPRSTPLQTDVYLFQVTGKNGQCPTIPAAATAVSINLTGLNASAVTNVRMYPANFEVPNAAVLNMVPGQGATPNQVTVQLSPDGMIAIYNEHGSINVIGDVMGYYRADGVADLAARVTALEAKVAALQAKTASMSKVTVDGQPTVRFSGVNVQVVSGSGATSGVVNGRGNLIVGYNENVSDTRTGSHNLIVGSYHTYTSYGGLVAGHDNTITGDYATVSGGNGNTASGSIASVSGGTGNQAISSTASVSGGGLNTASGGSATVSGGVNNTASGSYASVSGGNGRSAIAYADWRAGGFFQDF